MDTIHLETLTQSSNLLILVARLVVLDPMECSYTNLHYLPSTLKSYEEANIPIQSCAKGQKSRIECVRLWASQSDHARKGWGPTRKDFFEDGKSQGSTVREVARFRSQHSGS